MDEARGRGAGYSIESATRRKSVKSPSFVAISFKLIAWIAVPAFLLLVACVSSDVNNLAERISKLGFTDTFISYETFSEDHEVIVIRTFRKHLPSGEEEAASEISKVMWHTYPRDIDEFHVIINDENVSEGGKDDLVKMFGDRPIDAPSTWAPFVTAASCVVALLIALLVWRKYRRMRKFRSSVNES